MSSAITGAGGQKYRKLLVKQEGCYATDTAITLYTATQDCLMYIWRPYSHGTPYIKINGTVTTSNYSVQLDAEWVLLNDSDEDIEHHIEMCGKGRAKLYLNTGDYVTLISSNTNAAKVNYRVLV